MMQEHGFINEKFTVRYGCMCFHLAIYTRVDEIHNNSHMCASFVEFLEAFSRICDLCDSEELEKDIYKGCSNENIPLDKKIESAIMSFSYLKAKRSRR